MDQCLLKLFFCNHALIFIWGCTLLPDCLKRLLLYYCLSLLFCLPRLCFFLLSDLYIMKAPLMHCVWRWTSLGRGPSHVLTRKGAKVRVHMLFSQIRKCTVLLDVIDFLSLYYFFILFSQRSPFILNLIRLYDVFACCVLLLLLL